MRIMHLLQRALPACAALGLGCAGTPAITPAKSAPRNDAPPAPPRPIAAPVPTPASAPPPPPAPTQACTADDTTETCKRACDAGFMASCLRYGTMRRTPRPGPYDPREAAAAFEKACDANEVAACDALGLLYEGAALERDDPQAAALYRKACDAGVASGCGHLAVLRFQGESGVEATKPAEIAAALAQLTKACSDGHANSCSFLSSLHFVGKHVKKDVRRARELSEKGCSMGDFHGCEAAGLQWALNWNGAPMHQGRAMEFQARAFKLVEEECAVTGEFCGKLAQYYTTGQGLAPNGRLAISVLDDACQRLKSPAACSDLGMEYRSGKGVKQDFTKAVQLFEIGCKGNITTSCYELASHYQFGQGAPKDLSKSFAFVERSCVLGLAEGCDVLGTYYHNGIGVEPSNEKSLAARRRACGWASADACARLGIWFVLEHETSQDLREGVAHLARACGLDGGRGCFWWGLLYDRGWGVPRNPSEGRALVKRACKNGVEAACNWLRNPKDVPEWVKEREAKDAKKAP